MAAHSAGASAYFDEEDAARLVQKYSETVACQIVSPFGLDNPLQYDAIQIKEGMDNPGGFGAMYIVHWVGDYGCYGGSGTSGPQFTLVERSGGSSAPPVVKADYERPSELSIKEVTDLYPGEEEGTFHIEGFQYGEGDAQASPTTPVHYLVRVVYEGMEILETN